MFKKGDSYFLFAELPIHGDLRTGPILESKPIEIYEGIWIVKTPMQVLRNPNVYSSDKENIALTEYVHTGFHLKEPIVTVCVKIDRSVEKPDEYFWLFIGSLLLIKPLYIKISGKFVYGDQDSGFITNPGKMDSRSNIPFHLSKLVNKGNKNCFKYTEQDIENAKKIFPFLLKYFKPEANLRHSYNIQMFLQAFIFEKLHFKSSLYSKLFPLIYSLAGNPSKKHCENISKRLGKLLSKSTINGQKTLQLTEAQIFDRLQYIWSLHRYPELHGHIKEMIEKGDITPEEEDFEDLLDLAEIARVALLKTLLLNRKEYLEIPIPLTGISLKKEKAKDANKVRNEKAKAFFENVADLNTITEKK